jgi:F0F1-type ATP synthase membrane subunit b/b'
MVDIGPAFYVLATAFLLFVFFMFLFLRRTLSGFKEGFEDGKRN